MPAGSRLGWLLTLSVLCLIGFPAPAPLGAAEMKVPKPASREKCPVCGMFVAKYPDWLAAVRLKDGSHVYFDGPKDMFKYLQDVKKYDPARSPEDMAAVTVMDYYELAWFDAREAWFVLGSDVYGPMGRELIPLKREAEAREFMRDHKGTRILRFSEATPGVIKSLD